MTAEFEKPIRLGKKLIEKLEQIKEQEKDRGHNKVSYAIAGEILARRIDTAGGLRE